jgi:adenylate cyclase
VYVLSYHDSDRIRRHPLRSGDTIVGRAPNCDLPIDDASVSRRHACFSVTDSGCRVTDLGSRNGTYVNGNLVPGADIGDGDRIVLGRLAVSVAYSAADRFSLSEDHTLIEDDRTIYRPVSGTSAPSGASATGAGHRSLQLLGKVARSLLQNRPLHEVFAEIVNLTFETCSAERAFLVVRDDATGALTPRIACRRDGSDIRSASVSRTIVQRVITERVALLASDARINTRLGTSESLLAHDVRSLMCAPLWHEHDVIGVVYVDASLTQRFSATDLDLLTALANVAAIAIEQARLTARVNEEVRRRERLQRYHSPAVVDRIFEAGGDIDAPFLAQERDVSVLFADLVGFTTLSEGLTPAQTAALLNSFFERMADAVFDCEGTLDKFIGDALMAVFGAPLDQPDHAARAVRTARAMQLAVADLNQRSTGPPLRVRIGIHSGMVRVGDIGSRRRREYTVLGDVVNTASRLESSVARPGQIIISRATLDQLDPAEFTVLPLGEVSLRGRQAAVEVFDATAPVGAAARMP